jgi:hypothetical protein
VRPALPLDLDLDPLAVDDQRQRLAREASVGGTRRGYEHFWRFLDQEARGSRAAFRSEA